MKITGHRLSPETARPERHTRRRSWLDGGGSRKRGRRRSWLSASPLMVLRELIADGARAAARKG